MNDKNQPPLRNVTPQPQEQPPSGGQPNVPHRSREEKRQHKPDPATHRTIEEPRPGSEPCSTPTRRETEGDS
jgi:hypothetical protein